MPRLPPSAGILGEGVQKIRLYLMIDNTARVIKMRGKYLVKRRGMFVNEYYETIEDAQIVADRWNTQVKNARDYEEKEKARKARRMSNK